jgi:hypothetical protein
MSVELKTGRGVYRLNLAAAPESAGADLILPLALARADGIERLVFRCRVEGAIGDNEAASSVARLIERIAPAIEREFEIIREAALKSIRSEHKLLEIAVSSR